MKEKELKTNGTATTRLGTVLIVILCIMVIMFISGLIERGQYSRISAAITAETKTERVVITIEGMACTSCAAGIKAMLKRTPGVVSAEVSFERKEANVEYNPADTSREKIVESITNMGYKVRLKGN